MQLSGLGSSLARVRTLHRVKAQCTPCMHSASSTDSSCSVVLVDGGVLNADVMDGDAVLDGDALMFAGGFSSRPSTRARPASEAAAAHCTKEAADRHHGSRSTFNWLRRARNSSYQSRSRAAGTLSSCLSLLLSLLLLNVVGCRPTASDPSPSHAASHLLSLSLLFVVAH